MPHNLQIKFNGSPNPTLGVELELFTLNKNTEDIGLSFNFEYSNQVNNNLNFSISKKF